LQLTCKQQFREFSVTKKISVESLKEFNPAHYLNDSESLKEFIKLVEEEDEVSDFSSALKAAFLAIGANSVAKTLGMDVGHVWDVQEFPEEHLDDLKKIVEVIKNGPSEVLPANPYAGSNFEEFLREQGIYDEVTATAIKRILDEIYKQNSDKKGRK
jgi:hypothetical protein